MNKILLLAISFLLLLNSCKNNSVAPTEDKPGRRDYVWTVDTLNYPGKTLNRIWGSSPKDVWILGAGGDATKNVFHFDGEHWEPVYIIFHNTFSVFGFSQDNVYMCFIHGQIWHYDGKEWTKIVQLSQDLKNIMVFDNIWGDSPNNIYATGAITDNRGYANISVIAHYNGNKWTLMNTDDLIGIVERFYINKPDNKIYLQTYRLGAGEYPDSSLIFQYTENGYKRIYGNYWAHSTQSDISIINGEVYFIMGYDIDKRVNDEFIPFLHVPSSNFYQHMWGRNSKDIFLGMTDGLAHYNGSDIKYLFHFNKPRGWVFQAMLFDKEVFFIVQEPGLNLIYHGKLSE